MKLLALSTCAAALLAACQGAGDGASGGAGDPYLTDAQFRRATLVASLVAPENGYSRRRLAAYETGDANDWSRLEAWNPRVEAVSAGELDGPHGADPRAPFGPDARALALPAESSGLDEAALVKLGEEAFFRYPVQLEDNAAYAASSRASFAQYGFWTDAEHGAGGLVRVELPQNGRLFAYTCATCHAASRGGALLIGVGNDRLDLGHLAYDVAVRASGSPPVAERWLTWGPGRVDVTTTTGTEPVRIADVRPARWLTYLHADASVAQRDRASLAIRIETLIITSYGEEVRPPRVVALALAAYLWSMASALPSPEPTSPDASRGAAVFAATCASCHAPPAFTGPPVPLDVVGTDSTIGRSADRGTGTYRVPSLHGVATRGALLHDASLPSVASLLDPARLQDDFRGGRRGPGAVPGHRFGLSLEAGDRAALLAYLATL